MCWQTVQGLSQLGGTLWGGAWLIRTHVPFKKGMIIWVPCVCALWSGLCSAPALWTNCRWVRLDVSFQPVPHQRCYIFAECWPLFTCTLMWGRLASIPWQLLLHLSWCVGACVAMENGKDGWMQGLIGSHPLLTGMAQAFLIVTLWLMSTAPNSSIFLKGGTMSMVAGYYCIIQKCAQLIRASRKNYPGLVYSTRHLYLWYLALLSVGSCSLLEFCFMAFIKLPAIK